MKRLAFFVSGAGTMWFDFSLGLMHLNRIIFPRGSPSDFECDF